MLLRDDHNIDMELLCLLSEVAHSKEALAADLGVTVEDVTISTNRLRSRKVPVTSGKAGVRLRYPDDEFCSTLEHATVHRLAEPYWTNIAGPCAAKDAMAWRAEYDAKAPPSPSCQAPCQCAASGVLNDTSGADTTRVLPLAAATRRSAPEPI